LLFAFVDFLTDAVGGLVLAFFAFHENDRFVGFGGRKLVFLSVNELELFFWEMRRASVLIFAIKTTTTVIGLDLLHRNYMKFKIL
jgi:hypothetical protein